MHGISIANWGVVLPAKERSFEVWRKQPRVSYRRGNSVAACSLLSQDAIGVAVAPENALGLKWIAQQLGIRQLEITVPLLRG